MADTLELIKELPAELREKMIYREYIKRKRREKKAQGWDEVHEAIKSAPYCGNNQQIANIFFCSKCAHRAGIYCCNLCYRNGHSHYLDYPGFDKNAYDECFIRIHPNPDCCDVLREIYLYYQLE